MIFRELCGRWIKKGKEKKKNNSHALYDVTQVLLIRIVSISLSLESSLDVWLVLQNECDRRNIQSVRVKKPCMHLLSLSLWHICDSHENKPKLACWKKTDVLKQGWIIPEETILDQLIASCFQKMWRNLVQNPAYLPSQPISQEQLQIIIAWIHYV